MLKVCMITPKAYPVPAIRGGAVEGLVESFARENERERKVDLTVISRMDEKAQEIGKEFHHTKFHYVEYGGGILDKVFASRLMGFINSLSVRHLGHMLLEEPYIKRVRRILKQDEYDLVIVEDGYAPYGIVSRQIGREKMCWHLHGSYVGEDVMERWFAHEICVSDFIARDLVANGKVSVNHVDVLRNGIQTSRFAVQDPSYSRAEARARYGLGESDMVFAYWGRLIPQKGVRELLCAFQKVCQRIGNARLLIIGSPAFALETKDPYEESLRDAASRLGGGRVVFTGFVRNDELWRALHVADVAVLPSIWDEPGALANIEAGAAGLPLITTNVGGTPEYVNDSCALILDWSPKFEEDLADAMVRLAEDDGLRAEMGRHGLENAERHSASHYYEDYVQLLERYASEDAHHGNEGMATAEG